MVPECENQRNGIIQLFTDMRKPPEKGAFFRPMADSPIGSESSENAFAINATNPAPINIGHILFFLPWSHKSITIKMNHMTWHFTYPNFSFPSNFT